MRDDNEPTMDPLEHDGTVVAVEDGLAHVKFQRTTRCGSCGGCGVAQDGSMMAEVPAVPGLKAGDHVTVAIDPQGVWRGTFWTFVFPLAGLVGGAVLGGTWLYRLLGLSADLTAGLCGLAGLVIVFALGVLRSRSVERQPTFQPRIVRKL